MMAFGGAGPLHAAGVARELGIRRVLIPPAPGVFSALGLLRAEMEQHAARTLLIDTRKDPGAVQEAIDAMRADLLARFEAEGFAADPVGISAAADLRYFGQSAELTVPLSATELSPRPDA